MLLIIPFIHCFVKSKMSKNPVNSINFRALGRQPVYNVSGD